MLQPLSSIKIIYPGNMLRFFFTWRGFMVDRRVYSFIRKVFEYDRLKRLKQKRTQGMLNRLITFSATNVSELHHKSGYKRMCLGFTNTHTRSCYRNNTYRLAASWVVLNSIAFCNDDGSITQEEFGKTEVNRDVLYRCFLCDLRRHSHIGHNRCVRATADICLCFVKTKI